MIALIILLSFCFAWASEKINNAVPPDTEKLEEILREFDKYAEEGMKDWNIPGMAVGIIQGDRVIFAKGYGFRNLETSEPVTPETLFQIGSTSKAFTATLVAMIVEEGKFGWDDRVVDVFPGFMMYDPWVTREFRIVDVMAQRSGLESYSGDFLALMGYNRDQMIQAIRYIKPITSFRSAFAYQNHLFLVAAKLVEIASGKTWEDNVKDRIFKPLGMNSSSMDLNSFIESKNATIMYRRTEDGMKPLSKDDICYSWVYTYGPAGGINSNINDMTRWLRFQMSDGKANGNSLVSRETLDFLHAPKTIISPQLNPSLAKEHQYYCQGWVSKEKNSYSMVWHTGGTSGCKTMLAFVPNAKIGVVVLSNVVDNKLADALAEKFFDMYFGIPAQDYSKQYLEISRKNQEKAEANKPRPPASPVQPGDLSKYAGNYENEWFKDARIVIKGGKLELIFGPADTRFALKHWDRERFTAFFPGEEYDYFFINFITNEKGEITGMHISALEPGDYRTFNKTRE